MKKTKTFLIECNIEYTDDDGEFEIPNEINNELKESILDSLNNIDETDGMFMDSICENTEPFCPINKITFSVKEK